MVGCVRAARRARPEELFALHAEVVVSVPLPRRNGFRYLLWHHGGGVTVMACCADMTEEVAVMVVPVWGHRVAPRPPVSPPATEQAPGNVVHIHISLSCGLAYNPVFCRGKGVFVGFF